MSKNHPTLVECLQTIIKLVHQRITTKRQNGNNKEFWEYYFWHMWHIVVRFFFFFFFFKKKKKQRNHNWSYPKHSYHIIVHCWYSHKFFYSRSYWNFKNYIWWVLTYCFIIFQQKFYIFQMQSRYNRNVKKTVNTFCMDENITTKCTSYRW